ncbi:MAG: response regulator [Labilithrix sp.]|nr:response regulator [Labilithrix sp.]MCW5811427.1 response regulator [Labilithrix sp.]
MNDGKKLQGTGDEQGGSASGERLGRYLEPLAEALVVFDAATQVVAYTNEAMARLRGFATKAEMEAEDTPIWSRRSSELLHRVLPARRAAFERGEHERYVDEIAHTHKDGTTVRAELLSFLQRDEVSGALLVCARSRSLSDALSSRRHLQRLLDHLPDLVSFCDLDNRVLACNTRLERLYGVGPGELLGTVLPRATPVEALGDEPLREDRWLTFADDGHRELVEMLTILVRGSDGEKLGILGIGRDVTAARKTEEQLRAVQKMEAIGRLAGGVAHDFNNLLSVILSYTNLAIETLPPQHPLQEDFAEIVAAGKRGESLTRQLLTFSRRQLLQMTPLVIRDVVDTTGKMLGRLIGEDIELRFFHDGEPAAAKVDRGQLEQVIVNLVVNARDAMPEGGRLTIGTRCMTLDAHEAAPLDLPAGTYVCLSVEDNGVGMDPPTLARTFEPFFTTKGLGKGTGLGLATAYGIVKQSGGAITIESMPAVGTTVRIYLPRHAGTAVASSPKPPPANKVRGAETILVVEDEGPLRTVTRRILRAAGYEVLVAANAEEALRIAHEVGDRIDLVFTDVVMPGMNGGELVERLATLFPRIRVLITSGYTDEKLARSGVGEHRFLAKPYEPAQLVDAIRLVLDEASLP